MNDGLPLGLVADVMNALKAVWNKKLSSFRVVPTNNGVRVERTEDKKYVEPKRK